LILDKAEMLINSGSVEEKDQAARAKALIEKSQEFLSMHTRAGFYPSNTAHGYAGGSATIGERGAD
jgi:hypothetical protein